MSDFFPTPTTLDEAVLAAEYSQTNVEFCGITCTPSGYFYANGRRIGLAKAEALIAEAAAEEAATATIVNHDVVEAPVKRQPKRTGFTWDSLNERTKMLFYKVALVIEKLDADAARLGVDLHIPLAEAPRLTNLKKAGLLETVAVEGAPKSWRYLRVTTAGLERMESTRACQVPIAEQDMLIQVQGAA
jgi:hypothetical protein